MYENPKLNIYQGIIQYLLETTSYNLKRIAYLSNCPLKNIRSIYSFNEIPSDITTKINLLRLLQMVLELEFNNPIVARQMIDRPFTKMSPSLDLQFK